jgi:aromatic-L-amino-acid/L-tryptophan decarboxylase
MNREDASSWEWSAEEIKRIGYKVVDLVAEHLTTLPNRPVFRPVPKDLANEFLTFPAPTSGQEPEAILAQFAEQIEQYPFGNGHPRFYGWVNSPPTVMGIFADALAAAMNPSCAGGNHAAIYVERQVVQWFKQLVGFPAESMGLLLSGGSMAALTAVAVARHVKSGFDVRAEGLQGSHPRLIVYKSGEGHGCYQKAVELMGLGNANLRVVAQDSAQRMSVAALDAAIRQDLAQGHRPIAVVASAGTVNTGAIDPLAEIADVCNEHGVWLHVDGAYGGPAILSEKYRGPLSALARADSIALDPHKWLYVPVEAGLVLVRDREAMRNAFSLVPPYLRTDGSPTGVGGLPWFSEYGFQQTRGFRALKVWMALKHHGLEGYRRAIEKDLALAEYLADCVSRTPELELAEPQSLSIVCFRYVPEALRGNQAALNALNKQLVEEIQLGGQAFLSSTVMNEQFWLRACIVNFRAQREDIDALLSLVCSTGARLAQRTS